MTDFKTYKELKDHGRRLGRAGLSQRVIDLIAQFDGTYIGAMALAGRMKAISQAALFDDYWTEKVINGYHREVHDIARVEPMSMDARKDGPLQIDVANELLRAALDLLDQVDRSVYVKSVLACTTTANGGGDGHCVKQEIEDYFSMYDVKREPQWPEQEPAA